jgi:hypothetical protein
MRRQCGPSTCSRRLRTFEASPDAIVFAPVLHVNGYAKDEYVVDRRRLRNVRVLERFTR